MTLVLIARVRPRLADCPPARHGFHASPLIFMATAICADFIGFAVTPDYFIFAYAADTRRDYSARGAARQREDEAAAVNTD